MTQLNVFPVRVDSKAPAIRDWKARAAALEDWLATDAPITGRWGAPMGPTNGLWALDFDPRHAGAEATALLQNLPFTRTHSTPSGGLHFLFTWDARLSDIGNTAGVLAPGLDVRVDGGMVLVPPTAGYDIVDASPPVPAPEWLVEALTRGRQRANSTNGIDNAAPIRNPKAHAARAIAAAIEEIKSAPVGTRDDTMNRNAYGIGRIIGACGLDYDKTVEVLVDAAIEAGYNAAKALDCVSRAVRDGMDNPREVAASPITNSEPSQAMPTVQVGDAAISRSDEDLRPLPPKPGPAPADLTSEAGRRWQEKQQAYQEWMSTLRQHCEARLLVIQYDQTRVLYERCEARRVEVCGAQDVQVAAVRRIGRDAGLLVPPGTAEAVAFERRTAPDAARGNPRLWDVGDGLYRYRSPVVEEGPHPTWDGVLSRLSDPEAFLAHVWSAFEPKFQGRQVLWLQGEGNDGKTILFKALLEGAGVPFGIVSDADIQGSNQFLFSSLWDKPVVLVNESKSPNILMTGMMHKLTGRDHVTVEYKHGQRFQAAYQGVVWVCSNQSPNIEGSRSNLSRLSLLSIVPGQWVDSLPDRLRSEVPALLFRARRAYSILCPRDFEIALNSASQEALAEATGFETDLFTTALKMASLEVTGSKDDEVSGAELLGRLNRHTKMDAAQLKSFYRWLVAQGASKRKGKGGSAWKGIKC